MQTKRISIRHKTTLSKPQ